MTVRVLILLENQGYPGDPRVRRHAEALAEAGYEVTVVCPKIDEAESSDEFVSGVRAVRSGPITGGRGTMSYLSEYTVAILTLGRLARRRIAESGVDIVIACNPPDLLPVLARALVCRRAVVIFDHHDLSPELYERKFGRRGVMYGFLRALEQLAFRSADIVLEPNDSYAEIARQRGHIDPSRLFVVRHGPDATKIFPVDARPGLRRGRRFLVVWAGAMTGLDRLWSVIEVADELINRRHRRDVHFALLGSGDARDAADAEVRRRKLEDFVEFPGHADADLLRGYLSTADVCLSVDVQNEMNQRSTVTKVLDYMAMGRPVVQFPLREMQRLCGDATVYARNSDSDDLADKIVWLLEDPKMRARLGARARQRMMEGHMWDHQRPSLLAAVRAAGDRRAGAGAAGLG